MLHLAMKAFYPRAAAFPAAPRRYDLEVPRDDRASATRRPSAARPRPDRPHQPGRASTRASTRSPHGSAVAHPGDEDRGPEAGARQIQVRRRLRRRPPRRGEEPAPRSASSPSAPPTTRWDPKNQRPELWSLYNTRIAPGRERSASSRSRTGPSSTSGTTSAEKTFRSCRSTSPRTAPVVIRDGTSFMVDDERMPLEPGEKPRDRMVRFRTLGCYPLTGAIEIDADTLDRHRRRDAAPPHVSERAGPPDRPSTKPPRWRRRSARAISDGPQSPRSTVRRRSVGRQAPPEKDAAALPHLRLGR